MSSTKQRPAPPRAAVTVTPDATHATEYVKAWAAPSRTHSHIVYIVRWDRLQNAWSCECPGYGFNGHCAHIEACIAAQVAEWRGAKRGKAVAA